MKDSSLDRRQAEKTPAFPLIDSDGHEVRCERRSGKDRRKDKRENDIADYILNSLY